METQPNLKISIPKPCHEDWNKFTPDEKGAFCKVCSKSVHDFTKKTADEISSILIQEMSAGKKVCGRFNEDQLAPVPGAMLSLSPYALNFTRIKKFALALFLVFGGYLFNSIKSSAQKMGKVAYSCRIPVKGEVAYTPPVEKNNAIVIKGDTITVKPAVIEIPKLLGDVTVEPIEKLQIMGGVSAVQEEEPIEKLTMMGQAVITEAPEKLEIIKFTPPEIIDDSLTVQSGAEESLIMGLIEMPYTEEESILIDPIPSDTLQDTVEEEFAAEESTFVQVVEPEPIITEEIRMPGAALEAHVPKMECYPNPSTGLINVKYAVKENVQTGIVLYNMNGALVKTLVTPQNMYAADYSTRFDISELPDGIYFCTMQSGEKTATQRIILSR